MSAAPTVPPGAAEDPTAVFAGAVYEPADVVELRALRPGGPAQQRWCAALELLDPGSEARRWIERHRSAQWNIYAGVNPRTGHGDSTAAGVALARCQFVDFDGTTPERAAAEIASAGLPEPTLLVASGHGAHAYWRLPEPGRDLGRWTGVQRRLIALLGGDAVVHDPPRIMRLPGTTNWKDDPPVECMIVRRSPASTVVLELDPVEEGARYIADAPPAGASPGRWQRNLSRRTLQFLQFGAPEGTRNGELFKAACDLAGNGVSFEEAQTMLAASARRCGLADWEIERTARSAFAKGRRPSRPPPTTSALPADDGGADADDDDGGGAGAGAGGDDKGGRTPQRDLIVALAREQFRLGRSSADEPFAVELAGPNVARMFRGGRDSLRAQLALHYARRHGAAPSSSALADALLVLEGEAMLAEAEAVHLRLARHGDAVVLDLGDAKGRAVVIGPGQWRVVERAPVLFRRTALTAALRPPVRGGDLAQLRRFVNLAPAAWPLALGWLVGALIPDIEHPIVLLGGQQDAGKSTSARTLSGIVDPSPAPLRAQPRDLETWAVTAAGSWVVVVDNLSGIPEWFSDALCRAVTGEGLLRRSLFTDSLLSVLVFQRCMILTSIDAGALKGDLGRRLLHVDLEPITRTQKRPPAELRRELEAAAPAVLGALLELLARVLAELPKIRLEEFYGLADFEEVLAALDAVLGTDALAQYRSQWERIAADVVEGDPVAEAVLNFARTLEPGEAWEGTASALLRQITPAREPKDWPRNARALGGQLRRAIPVLLAMGVEVVPPRPTDKLRRYLVRPTAHSAQPPQGADGSGGRSGGPGGPARGISGALTPSIGTLPAAALNHPHARPPVTSSGEGSHPVPEEAR